MRALGEKARGALASIGIASLFTLPLAAPLLGHPRSTLYGAAGDPYGTLAGFQRIAAWFATGEAAVARPRPMLLEIQPLVDLPAVLIATITGEVAAYNLLMLIGFPLAALFGYLAAREVTSHRGAAIVSSLAFAFSPYHFAHAREHLDQAQVAPVALLLWCAIRLLKRPGTARAAGFLVAYALAALVNWYLAVLLLPVVALVIVGLVVARGPGWRGAMLVLMVPLIALVVTNASSSRGRRVTGPRTESRQGADLIRYSARLPEYLRPSQRHPLFGDSARQAFQRDRHGSTAVEQTLYLGWVPLLVAIIGGFRLARQGGEARRLGLFLLALFLLSVWLSLHPDWGASAAVARLTPNLRAVARFGLVAQAALSLLVAAGLSGRGRIVLMVVAGLIAVEQAERPSSHAVEPIEVSRLLSGEARGVADFPSMPNRYLRLYRPITPAAVFSPRRLAEVGILRLDDPSTAERLAGVGVSHVVVHDDQISVPDGLRLRQTFTGSRVFEVAAEPLPVTIETRHGFAKREPEGVWMLGSRASIGLRTDVGHQAVTGRFSFVATSLAGSGHDPGSLGIEAPDVLPLTAVTPEGVRIVLPITAPYSLALRVTGLPGTGKRLTDDPRSLTVHLSELRFEIEEEQTEMGRWRYADGFLASEPGGRRWLTGDATIVVEALAQGRGARFEIVSLGDDRGLSITCDGHDVAELRVSPVWKEVRVALPEDCEVLRFSSGEPRSIREVTGVDDDRQVSVALRYFRLVSAPETP